MRATRGEERWPPWPNPSRLRANLGLKRKWKGEAGTGSQKKRETKKQKDARGRQEIEQQRRTKEEKGGKEGKEDRKEREMFQAHAVKPSRHEVDSGKVQPAWATGNCTPRLVTM